MSSSTFNKYIARYMMLGDGFRKLVIGITGPTSYVLGGETITPQQVSLGAIEWWPDTSLINSLGALVTARYNYTTGKLQYFLAGGGGGGELSYTPGDLKGATTIVAGSVTTDQAALPVNGALWKAATVNSTLAGTITPTTQPDIPRNVQVSFTNDSGGNLDIFAAGGTVTFTVTGFYRGVAQTDTILFTVTAPQSAVVTAKFRFAQGVKPFDTITSVTYDHTADIAAGMKLSIGPGSLLGLPAPRATPADADVLVFAISSVPQTVAGAFSDTNQTVQTGTTADGFDLNLVYNSGAIAGGGEAASTADLSGYTGRTLVHGR